MSDKLSRLLLASAGADLVEIRDQLNALADRLEDENAGESAASRALAGWLDGVRKTVALAFADDKVS